MWIYGLSALIVFAGALTISAEYRGPRRVLYVFKPLTVVLIILLSLISKYPVSSSYKYLIVAGLACSLIGDVCLMLPADHFIFGLISFLIAHLIYVTAFLSDSHNSFSVLVAIPLVVYGALMLMLLWNKLEKLKVPVMVYVLALLLMAWLAISRYVTTSKGGSLLAAFGAILFVMSDSVLALNKFKKSFRIAQLLILTTYFAAQYLIALST